MTQHSDRLRNLVTLSVDDRTFEQKHGTRCPFCGKNWNDRTACGNVDPGWTWREQMSASFRNRSVRRTAPTSERVCVRCLVVYEGIAGQMYCGKRCLNQTKTQRYRDAHAVTKACAWCGDEYQGRAESRYCSSSHANMRRPQGRRKLAA